MTKTLMMGAACAALAACAGGEQVDAEGSLAETQAPGNAERGFALPAGDVGMTPSDWASADVPTRPGDAAVEARIADLIARMSTPEKVGQILQPEILNVTPQDVRDYHIGSVLNGGNGRPNRDPYAGVDDWLEMADAFYEASVDTSDGGVAIPIVWGTDSVHGNNSLFGGTVFPHNIGLGAANDPALMEEIGRVTAVETSAMGADWTFAPAVSVARDDRWGRTYESYSEDQRLAAPLGAAYTRGLQGDPTTDEAFFAPGSIIATAKHFIADGGTENGRDQGDAKTDEAELREVHYPPYVAAVEAGAQTVMASYSKWNGVRMHGHGPLLTSVLKDQMGFDGFVVGDFNGHALIEGCTNADCPEALLAGVDMYMIPAEWKALFENTLAQVEDGTIPMSRLDDAVRRVLRIKARSGLLDAPKPSERPFAGTANVGTPEHLDVARRAARQSMVLLKNDGALPLSPSATVLVAGDGADSLPKLVGGWSMNWQGSGLDNDDFPTGITVLDAMRSALEAGGGEVVTGTDGAAPDAAVIVFGEDPYAEYQGDRESVLYAIAENDPDLALMRELSDQGVPVVGVFVSGRPLWINPHLNAARAMVAAFLPGTEGGRAVADLLVQDADAPRYDFTGGLSFSWPKTAAQTALNEGADGYDPLFPLGYGLSLSDDGALAALPEDPGLSDTMAAAAESSVFFEEGRALAPWRVYVGDAEEARLKTEGDRFVTSRTGAIAYESADRNRQEDTKRIAWSGSGMGRVFVLGYAPVDFARRAEAGEALVMEASVARAPGGTVTAAMGSGGQRGEVDATSLFAEPGDYRTVSVPLSCFAGEVSFGAVDMPFSLESAAPFELMLADLRLGAPAGDVLDCEA